MSFILLMTQCILVHKEVPIEPEKQDIKRMHLPRVTMPPKIFPVADFYVWAQLAFQFLNGPMCEVVQHSMSPPRQ
jgi:hypothetical protein